MIGVLYESGEWSDYKLATELAETGCGVRMIDTAHLGLAAAVEAAGKCDLLVSRVFASAVFRGHGAAHETMREVCRMTEETGIPMVNPARAHFFEIDKRQATMEMAREGIDTPLVLAFGMPGELHPSDWDYPCIVKPNCGGRTTCTAVARTEAEAVSFLAAAPAIEFIVEDYIEPERGFITRVELIDGACALVVKRSVVAGGLSAYHLGSRYELYPECSEHIRTEAESAGRVLDIGFGSFDIIEHEGRAFVIDANSVSNVSPDNTDMFECDLMFEYAQAIARKAQGLGSTGKGEAC